MNTKKYISGTLALTTVAGLVFALPLFADTTTTAPPVTRQTWTRGMGGGIRAGMMRSSIVGTVLTNDGSTLTITVKKFSKPVAGATTQVAPTTVTYTVTTGATTVTKAGVASTVSGIAVGDIISVQGAVSGTSVTATSIRDGVMMVRGQQGSKNGKAQSAGNIGTGAASLVAGNGQPIVGGAITAISGNTLTVTNKSNITYTVDVTSAKFLQGSTTIAISGVKVGDSVVVQGTVNGTNIVASTVIDQTKPADATTSAGNNGKHLGFFGGIGNFFAHLFGF